MCKRDEVNLYSEGREGEGWSRDINTWGEHLFGCSFLEEMHLSRHSIMRSSTSFAAVFTAVALLGQSLASPSNIKQRDLDSFIASERAIALQGVLNNIGDKGSKAQGASKGIIIASPSKADPDCKIPSPTSTCHHRPC